MRIIQQGKQKETHTFICRVCGCVFEADKGEFTFEFFRNEEYFKSICPFCKLPVYTNK